MAASFADRVAEVSISTGTGSMALGVTPVLSYQSWASGYVDGAVLYGIVDEATGDWEVGEGTLSGTGILLTRTLVVDSSLGGTAVSFGVGNKIVFSTEISTSLTNDQGIY